MQKAAWRIVLAVSLLLTLVIFTGAVAAQESSTAAPAQAAATPYNPAAAFATPAAKPASSPASSEGPDPDRKWEVEFHGGGILSTNPDGGKSALPAPGVPFTTTGGTISRAISSYYFGDGALLFNQFQTAGSCPGCTPIVPLDGVLTHSTAERSNGGAFGFRISRDISPRWGIEANFDYSLGQMEITTPGLAGIEATRAGYATAWTNFFAAFPAFSAVTVSSAATLRRTEGRQIFGTAGVNINLLTEGRLIPYLSLGGGVVANTGDAPSALLVGDAQFTLSLTFPHHQTDTVLTQWSLPDVQGVGYFGGGFKYYVRPRWGIRLDVRDYLSNNALKQFVSASPLVATLAPAQAICSCRPVNDIQFSNNPPSGPDTMSGPAISRFRTFTGDGVRHQIAVSGGVFFRF